MRVVLAIPTAMIPVGAAPFVSVTQGPGSQQKPIAIEFRLAEDAPGPGLTEAEVAGERAYSHSRVGLSNEPLAQERLARSIAQTWPLKKRH